MNKYLILIVSFLLPSGVCAAVSINGCSIPVITINPPANTGLDAVYIVNSLNDVSVSFSLSSPNSECHWYKYGILGGGFAEEITDISRNGNIVTLANPESDTGYIIEDNSRRTCFWIVDYSRHPFAINSITPSNEQTCDWISFDVQGEASRITYTSVNGNPVVIDREITVKYNILVPDQESVSFFKQETEESFPFLTASFDLPAPLCDTSFSLSGDRFLREWGIERTIESDEVETQAVAAVTKAEQQNRDNDNEKHDESETFGGSAPVNISFDASVSDAALFTEWQFSTDPEFSSLDLRVNDLLFEHTFNDMGVVYVRFVCANASGDCEYFSDTYTVDVAASELQCPNAFSPNDDGVNDVWKVSYRSIVDFECHIFNRWGVKIISFDDPAKGWDGKIGGKTVSPGVYYYVIKARGADDRTYDLSGDINIIGYK